MNQVLFQYRVTFFDHDSEIIGTEDFDIYVEDSGDGEADKVTADGKIQYYAECEVDGAYIDCSCYDIELTDRG